jgi:hypothetical protein
VIRRGVALLWLVAASTLEADAPPEHAVVARVGAFVGAYYARAQTLVADETVTVQPLNRDLTADGFPRRLVYELRLEWDPGAPAGEPPATVVRQLLSVNGRPPRAGDEPRCLDPRPVSPEPLAFLLPDRRHAFTFGAPRPVTVDDEAAVVFEFRSVRAEPPRVEWRKDCATIELPGRSRGRIWADPETGAILRVDEQLTGIVDIPVPDSQQRRGAPRYLTVERADMSIRYRAFQFEQPDEVLRLPAAVETVVVIRNAGVPRFRVTQTYANYRRFVTESRVLSR